MKVEDINYKDDDSGLIVVSFEPSWYERLTGIVGYDKEYKITGNVFETSNRRSIISKDGEQLLNNSKLNIAINNFLNSW